MIGLSLPPNSKDAPPMQEAIQVRRVETFQILPLLLHELVDLLGGHTKDLLRWWPALLNLIAVSIALPKKLW